MTRICFAVLVTCLFAISGCGGSTASISSTSSGHSVPVVQTRPLTRAQLIAKTDAICLRVHAKLASTTARTVQQLGSTTPELSAYEEQAVADLRQLTPGGGAFADDWNEIVEGIRVLANDTAKVGAYARANDFAKAHNLIEEFTAARQRVLRVSKRAGFIGCEQIAH